MADDGPQAADAQAKSVDTRSRSIGHLLVSGGGVDPLAEYSMTLDVGRFGLS